MPLQLNGGCLQTIRPGMEGNTLNLNSDARLSQFVQLRIFSLDFVAQSPICSYIFQSEAQQRLAFPTLWDSDFLDFLYFLSLLLANWPFSPCSSLSVNSLSNAANNNQHILLIFCLLISSHRVTVSIGIWSASKISQVTILPKSCLCITWISSHQPARSVFLLPTGCFGGVVFNGIFQY